jgi:nucleoside 2-deoxyribosyltransferase
MIASTINYLAILVLGGAFLVRVFPRRKILTPTSTARIRKVYLAGAIQDSTDSGIGWRDRLTPKLEQLGWSVYNPCKSEANLADGTLDQAKETMANWIASGQRELFVTHMRAIRKDDLRMVKESSVVIVYLDQKQKPGGTIAEMQVAFDSGIPLYVMSRDALKDMNHWVLSLIWDGGYLFDSWTALIDAIERNYVNAQ